MRTDLLLMVRYEGLAVIPLERVAQDFFAHMTVRRLHSLIARGDIALPLVPGNSQKAAPAVALEDLAVYLDRQIAEGRKEFQQIHGKPFAA